MKIIKTNWINATGVFIAVFLYAIILNLHDVNASTNLFQSILPALILVGLFGFVFWMFFIALLVILDLLLLVKNRNNLIGKILLEWLLIGSPFIYWGIKYKEWIFIIAVIAFLITQMMRIKIINRDI